MGKEIEFDVPAPGLFTVMTAVPALAMRLDGTDALSCEEFTKVVANNELFHCTAELAVKLIPDTVRLNVAPPTLADVGKTLVTVGMAEGVPITKTIVFETTPPDVWTVMLAVPCVDRREAGTWPLSWVELFAWLVMRGVPFQSTTAPVPKPEPFTVKLKPPLPGGTAVGLIDVMTGPLLAPMTKVIGLEARLLVVTVTVAEPAAATRFAGTTVVNCVELTYVVGRFVAPFQLIIEPGWKPEPFTVSANAGPPGVAKFGFRLLMPVPTKPLTAK